MSIVFRPYDADTDLDELAVVEFQCNLADVVVDPLDAIEAFDDDLATRIEVDAHALRIHRLRQDHRQLGVTIAQVEDLASSEKDIEQGFLFTACS